MRQLGRDFDNYLKINFEEHSGIGRFFDQNLDPERIARELGIYFGAPLNPGSTLFFFDEVQYEPKAIVALRYFFEKMPELHVIAAGSLIEFELELFYLYPLSFGEFLTALGKSALRELIKSNSDVSSPIHEQVKYLETVFSSVPVRLGRKFKYSNVSTLYKSRELKEALDLLEKASLLYRVNHSGANGIPLYAERDDRKFKVIFFDTGLALNWSLIHQGRESPLSITGIGKQNPVMPKSTIYWKKKRGRDWSGNPAAPGAALRRSAVSRKKRCPKPGAKRCSGKPGPAKREPPGILPQGLRISIDSITWYILSEP